ncbi:chaplin [Kitasatospora sp. McL0602]|uniref:chaplin n=1 Tax=Kitasatospora sp. McL0602 TaxID=3439530 RepID=UPI003F8C1840
MRQVAKRGILTAVATGSVLASTAGYAYASAEAQGGAVNSPGVGSGNAVQVPVDIPVNACGNTVDVVGLLNPAMGNSCGNSVRSMPVTPGPVQPGHHHPGQQPPPPSGLPGDAGQWHPGAGHLHPDAASYGSSAAGVTHGSPGVAAGNQVQAPVTAPVNACGNTVDVIGLGNPAFGNNCGNAAAHTPPHAPPHSPPHSETPPPPPAPAPGDDCTPGGPGTHNPPPPASTPPASTPPVSTPPVSTPPTDTTGGTTTGVPGSDRNGGPGQTTPVSITTGNGSAPTTIGSPAGGISEARQGTRAFDTAPAVRGQLASTGTSAAGLGLAGTAGMALMLGGGILYRRSRAGAR